MFSDRPKGWHLTKVVRFTYVFVYVCVFIPICKKEKQLAKLLVRDLFIPSLSTKIAICLNEDP